MTPSAYTEPVVYSTDQISINLVAQPVTGSGHITQLPQPDPMSQYMLEYMGIKQNQIKNR